jgi:hypothetical protein
MAFTKKVKTAKEKPAKAAPSLPEKSGTGEASQQPPMQHVEGVVEFEMSEDITKLAAALVAYRKTAKNPSKDKAGYNYQYTTLDNLITSQQKDLAANGLAVLQTPCSDGRGGVGVVTMLLHTSGQFIRGRYILPIPVLVGSNAAQEAGAALTYARRYGIAAILNLASDEDNDAAEVGKSFRKKS